MQQKLLLVEDDTALQFTIVTALEENGYAVDAVSTTGEAIERLGDTAYPIVISDIYVDERTGPPRHSGKGCTAPVAPISPTSSCPEIASVAAISKSASPS